MTTDIRDIDAILAEMHELADREDRVSRARLTLAQFEADAAHALANYRRHLDDAKRHPVRFTAGSAGHSIIKAAARYQAHIYVYECVSVWLRDGGYDGDLREIEAELADEARERMRIAVTTRTTSAMCDEAASELAAAWYRMECIRLPARFRERISHLHGMLKDASD